MLLLRVVPVWKPVFAEAVGERTGQWKLREMAENGKKLGSVRLRVVPTLSSAF